MCGNVGGEQGPFGHLKWAKCKETDAHYMRGLLQSHRNIVPARLEGFILERHIRIVVFFGTCTHIFESPRMEPSQAFALLVHTDTRVVLDNALFRQGHHESFCLAAREQLGERTTSYFKPHQLLAALLAQTNSRHGNPYCWTARANGPSFDRRIGHLACNHPANLGSRGASASHGGVCARATRSPQVLGRVRATCTNRRSAEGWQLELMAILLPTLQQWAPRNRRTSY